jgi:hypothetical protein
MDEPTRDEVEGRSGSTKMPFIELGALIGVGAGVGLVYGVVVGNIAISLACGAGLGTVAGAVFESTRKRR